MHGDTITSEFSCSNWMGRDSRTPIVRLSDNLMTRRHFFSHVSRQIHEENGIFMLPLCIILLVLFTGMVDGHERSVSRQSIRSAVRDDIVENCNYDYLREIVGFKNIDNVNVPYAVIDWLQLGYFSHLLWKTANENGTLTGRYLQYNRIVGGVRLLTQRLDESVAQCEDQIADALGSKCMFQTTDDWTAEGYDDLAFPPDGEETAMWSAGPDFEPNALKPHRIVWFMMTENITKQRETLASLTDTDFIDRKTRQVQASMLLYNADLHIICLVEANFFFARTGRVWPLLRIKTIDPDPFAQRQLLFFDSIFLAILLINFLKDIRVICIYWMKTDIRHLNKTLPHGVIWYVLDIVGLCVGISLALTFLRYYQKAEGLVEELQDNFAQITNQDVILDLFDHVEEVVHKTVVPYRYVQLLYPFSLLMRLGLSFSGNPRLSMITRVFSEAGTVLYHYLMVFLSFIATFTVLGLLMFGREVESYSTFGRSLQSVVQMLFGDVDWEELSVIGFVRATCFYWIFHITLVLVMFNILIAIVLDTYEDLRTEIGTHIRPQTLIQQSQATYRRMLRQHRGEIVKLDTVWMACLRKYSHQILADEPFSLEELKTIVPELPQDQADDLFKGAGEYVRKFIARELEQGDPLLLEMRKMSRMWRALSEIATSSTSPRLANVSPAAGARTLGSVSISKPPPAGLTASRGKREAVPELAVPELLVLPGRSGDYAEGDAPVLLDSLAATLRFAQWLAERPPLDATAKMPSPFVNQAVRLALELADRGSATSDIPAEDWQPCDVHQADVTERETTGPSPQHCFPFCVRV